MSKTIFIHEFRTRLRSVIIWSASIGALIVFFLSLYKSFADQAQLLDMMMQKFPPALLDAFGMRNMQLSTVLGFFSFCVVFAQLCLAIQAGNYGFGLVSVEEAELTADFLLSKPVSRRQVILSKLLAAVCALLITDIVVAGVSFAAVNIFRGSHEYDTGTFFLLLSSLPIFQLFFLSVGLVISLLVKRVRSVTPYSMGLGFGMYVLAAFSGIFGDVKLEYITAFKHLDPAYIVANKAFDTPLLLLNVAITVIALAASYVLYIRRDIPAVS